LLNGEDTTYIVYVVTNPNDGEVMAILVTDTAVARDMLATFSFSEDTHAGISAKDDWVSYENIRHRYRIMYPPGGGTPSLADPSDAYSAQRPETGDAVIVPTPRGVMGVWALTATSTAVFTYFGEYQQTMLDLLSLDAERLTQALCEEQAARAQAAGEHRYYDTCVPSEIRLGTVAGLPSYTVSMTGDLNTPLLHVLVPGQSQAYEYTFFQGSRGQKFLVWYPAGEPVFDDILATFEVTD
jgi:hypothetical protein